MPAGRWLVFDTNVYVAALREGAGGPASEQLKRLVPRTYLAAVVSAELHAGALEIAAAEHAVDHAGELLDRLRQPAALELHVLGDQPGDDDTRLVQHHVAERHALRDRLPGEGQVLLAAGIAAGLLIVD